MTDIRTRRERVQQGSRRKRDLAAIGAPFATQKQRSAEAVQLRVAEEEIKLREREDRLRPRVEQTDEAGEAWAHVTSAVANALKAETTFNLWIAPLACIGEVDGALCIEGHPDILRWTERRYGRLLGNAVREVSNFRGVFLFTAVEDEGEAEVMPCL